MPLQIRRGTAAERTGLTTPLAIGELLYVTDQGKLYIGDGTSIGSADIAGNAGQGGKGLIITGFTTEEAQDAVNTLLTNGTHPNIIFNYNDSANSLSTTLDLSSYTGNVTIDGTVEADFIGSIFASDSSVLVDAVDRKFFGDLEGNVLGSIVGDIKGSVFGDDSTLLVDGVNGRIVGPVFANVTGNLIGNVIGNLTGNTTGVHTGNIETNLISSADSSAIVFDTPVTFQTSVDIDGSTRIYDGLEVIAPDALSRMMTLNSSFESVEASTLIFRRSRGSYSSPTPIQTGDILGGLTWNGFNGSSYETAGTMYLEVTDFTSGIIAPSLRINLRRPSSAGGNVITIAKIDATSVNLYGRNENDSPLQLWNFHDTAGNASNLVLNRTRGSLDSPTVVQNGDAIYDIVFRSWDGTAPRLSAQIRASVDGAVSSNIVPGRLEFFLADLAGITTSVLRLTNDKVVRADKLGGLSNSYTEFTQMPVLPTYADDTAADTAIGGSGNRINGMMFYNTALGAIRAVVGGSWTSL